MKVVLIGGPRDGTTIDLRELIDILLMPVETPYSMIPNIPSEMPPCPVAMYECTYQATINKQGQVVVVIYTFKGMQ